jgi:hypothetical protein
MHMPTAYSWDMASTGQVSAQAPQSMQASGSITYWSAPWEIASTGQFGAQAPQETQSLLILYAIMYTSKYLCRAFSGASKSPVFYHDYMKNQ